MARMHSNKKGKAGSTRPPWAKTPEWFTRTPEEVEDIIVKLAREGKNTSMIGLILRDQYGVPLVKPLLQKTISQILVERNLKPNLPEDITNLIRRAINVRRHLEENKKDKNSKRGLQLIEAKIYRLAKYYRETEVVPKDWKYDWRKAAILIR